MVFTPEESGGMEVDEEDVVSTSAARRADVVRERYPLLRRTVERVFATARAEVLIALVAGLAAALRRKPCRAIRCGNIVLGLYP